MAFRSGDSLLVAQSSQGTCRRCQDSFGSLFAGRRRCLFDWVRELCGLFFVFDSLSSLVVATLYLLASSTIVVYGQAYLCGSAMTQPLAGSRVAHLWTLSMITSPAKCTHATSRNNPLRLVASLGTEFCFETSSIQRTRTNSLSYCLQALAAAAPSDKCEWLPNSRAGFRFLHLAESTMWSHWRVRKRGDFHSSSEDRGLESRAMLAYAWDWKSGHARATHWFYWIPYPLLWSCDWRKWMSPIASSCSRET